MATTARLPEALKREAYAYAEGLGVSLNALLAVALRDYLDARRGLAAASAQAPQAAPVVRQMPALPVDLAGLVAMAPPSAVRVHKVEAEVVPGRAVLDLSKPPPGGRKARCLCGSGKPWSKCHEPHAAGMNRAQAAREAMR